ncbi:MAG TPA: molybdate ABC transporter permease subunit, partial [Rhodobacteraceae bacterium]|nr:molybdate ABC transporter permease subunit [Paracoccaceae bacterium]
MMLDAAGWDALLLSLLVGVTSIVIALPLAIWVAWVLARRTF